MKKSWLFLLASILATSGPVPSEAVVVRLESGPNMTLTNRQPLQAVFVEGSGNSSQRTFYYDPSIGGINLDMDNLAPDTTVYFPELGTGYIWYNGYWVDQSGYYWNGSNRTYINNPQWNNYWTDHWHGHHGWHGNNYNRWDRDDRDDRYDRRSYWDNGHQRNDNRRWDGDHHYSGQNRDWQEANHWNRHNNDQWGGNVWQGKQHEGRDDDNWHGKDWISGQRDSSHQGDRGHDRDGEDHKSNRK